MTAPLTDSEAAGGGGLIPPLNTSAPTPRSRSLEPEAPLLPPFLARPSTSRLDDGRQDRGAQTPPFIELSPVVVAPPGPPGGEFVHDVSAEPADRAAETPENEATGERDSEIVIPGEPGESMNLHFADGVQSEAARISADLPEAPASEPASAEDYGVADRDSPAAPWEVERATGEAWQSEVPSDRSSDEPEAEISSISQLDETLEDWTTSPELAEPWASAAADPAVDSSGRGWATESDASASEGLPPAAPAWSIHDLDEGDETRLSTAGLETSGEPHSWLDSGKGGAGPASVPSWQYEELTQPTDYPPEHSSGAFADVETSSFVARPAEPDASGIVDPPGADHVLGAGAGVGGEVPLETADSSAASEDSWKPDGWLAAISRANDRTAARDSTPVDEEETRARELADRLEKIAQALREKGVNGPLSGDSADPLGALIAGYLFGLGQGQTGRAGRGRDETDRP